MHSGNLLGADGDLAASDRELVIDRVTARLGCEYEWGVHVAFFAERVGLTADQIRSITHGSPDDPCWEIEDGAVLRLVDSLIDTANVDDVLWARAAARFTRAQLLDILLLAGWYHAVAFAANAARVPLEEGAPRFAEYS
jgi:alkylhydroperoxidase family enzyme